MTTKPKLEQIRACLRRVSNPFRTKKKSILSISQPSLSKTRNISRIVEQEMIYTTKTDTTVKLNNVYISLAGIKS